MRRDERWLHGSIARRPWLAAERRVVRHGFWGRFLIAIQPLVIAGFFATIAVVLSARGGDGARFVAPIFAGASVLFAIYATVLMLPVTRALIESYGSIWVVDGYVRYRTVLVPFRDPVHYVAVLDARGDLLGEWPLASRTPAFEARDAWPAHVEFTPYAGVLRIDGRSTGVLPDALPAFGVGAPQAYAERADPEA